MQDHLFKHLSADGGQVRCEVTSVLTPWDVINGSRDSAEGLLTSCCPEQRPVDVSEEQKQKVEEQEEQKKKKKKKKKTTTATTTTTTNKNKNSNNNNIDDEIQRTMLL